MHDRIHLLVMASALAAGMALAAPAVAQQTADRIWHGGPVLTMNDAAIRAEAVAEAGGGSRRWRRAARARRF